MKTPIGGYFEWELPSETLLFPHSDGILVNSGRHALEMILQSLVNIEKLYIPFFTCDAILQPLQRLNINYVQYRINDKMEIKNPISLAPNEYLLYTNYFGIKDDYVALLAAQYGAQLIIDNAQALFAKKINNCSQFYSPRKFVGCPDGGIVISHTCLDNIQLPIGKSYNNCASLLQRVDNEISLGYKSFRTTSAVISAESLTSMSSLTKRILGNINYASIVEKRRANFSYLHSRLSNTNMLSCINSNNLFEFIECPMVYPYRTTDNLLRQRLIDNQVFVASYWPNVLSWCSQTDLEYQLTQQIIPLPIDQRYGEEEMNYIINLI